MFYLISFLKNMKGEQRNYLINIVFSNFLQSLLLLFWPFLGQARWSNWSKLRSGQALQNLYVTQLTLMKPNIIQLIICGVYSMLNFEINILSKNLIASSPIYIYSPLEGYPSVLMNHFPKIAFLGRLWLLSRCPWYIYIYVCMGEELLYITYL